MDQEFYIDYSKLSREELIKELETRDKLIGKSMQGIFNGINTCRELYSTLRKVEKFSAYKTWLALWVGYYCGKSTI